MKHHATAPAFSVGPHKIEGSFCPECHDLMIAAAMSQLVKRDVVRHFWACESCGHEFRTTVHLPAVAAEHCCPA